VSVDFPLSAFRQTESEANRMPERAAHAIDIEMA